MYLLYIIYYCNLCFFKGALIQYIMFMYLAFAWRIEYNLYIIYLINKYFCVGTILSDYQSKW